MGFFPMSQNISKQMCTSTDSARPWPRGNINLTTPIGTGEGCLPLMEACFLGG